MQDKVAIITGSARGIGAAIAERLAQAGARVVINSMHSVDAGCALANQLPEAFYCQADVRDPVQCARLVEQTLSHWGRVDVLINNVGVSRQIAHDDWDAMTDEVFQDLFQRNVLTAWNMTKAARDALKASQDGAIVNITSISGVYTMGSSIPYAIAKAALNHLTKMMAKVLAPEVRVNAVAPGFTVTEKTAGEEWQALQESLVARTLLRRAGTPEEIAETVLGVLRSTLMTGQVVVVDGGLS